MDVRSRTGRRSQPPYARRRCARRASRCPPVGAAYGILVLVFQKGVGTDLLGFTQVGRIDAWVPIFLFSVLFGLSMDYKVFLLSRIHERWGGHRSTPPAQSPTAWRRPHA